MKRLFTILAVLMFTAQIVSALPHLTCDKYVPGPCTPGTIGCNAQGQLVMPTTFVLKFDFATHPDVTIPARVDAQNKVDLWWEITIQNGVYTARALACVQTDKCSEPSQPVTFTKAIPVLPVLRIVQQGTSTFLTSDPYAPGSGVGIPDDFLVRKDGAQGTITSVAKIDATGKIILWYDLTGLSSGTHTFQVSARNMWGASVETAVFSYVKETPVKPAMKIQK